MKKNIKVQRFSLTNLVLFITLLLIGLQQNTGYTVGAKIATSMSQTLIIDVFLIVINFSILKNKK